MDELREVTAEYQSSHKSAIMTPSLSLNGSGSQPSSPTRVMDAAEYSSVHSSSIPVSKDSDFRRLTFSNRSKTGLAMEQAFTYTFGRRIH